MRSDVLMFLVVISGVGWAGAQTPAADSEGKLPVFSVVSVKPSAPDERGKYQQTQDGLIFHGQSVFRLIQAAYGLAEPYWISGAPGWTEKESYDVDAKVDEADIEALAKLAPSKRNEMLRAVLDDRFKLKYHWETKDLDDFALVVAKGGPNAGNLKPSDPSEKMVARLTGHMVYEGRALTIDNLINMVLATESQRWVVDRTGLAGKYDFTLRWSHEASAVDGVATADAVGPSIFTAVQEQLGLKLEPVKVATKIMVIESVERPSGNDK